MRAAKKQVPVERRREDTVGTLEELRTWCQEQMVEAQHGSAIEDAGRASAYARVITRIRSMQRTRTTP